MTLVNDCPQCLARKRREMVREGEIACDCMFGRFSDLDEVVDMEPLVGLDPEQDTSADDAVQDSALPERSQALLSFLLMLCQDANVLLLQIMHGWPFAADVANTKHALALRIYSTFWELVSFDPRSHIDIDCNGNAFIFS